MPAAGPAAWATMLEAALDFVDRFGPEVEALSWTAPQLFGVHPQRGTLRTDWCGALMLSEQKATGVDTRCVAFSCESSRSQTNGSCAGIQDVRPGRFPACLIRRQRRLGRGGLK